MPLLPHDDFHLETRLAPEEIVARLVAAVEPVRWFRTYWDDHLPFQGEVNGTEFRITRIIHYRNSFLPIIRGRVVATESGSCVEGTLELHRVVAVFMALWFGLGLTFGLAMLVLVTMRDGWNPVVLVPVGMLVGAWALVAGAFTLESRRSLRLLREIVGAELELSGSSVVG